MNLSVATVQADLIWEQPEQNRRAFEARLQSIEADVIVLPEAFTTGFSMVDGPHVETWSPHGATPNWLRRMAQERDALVMGSVLVRADGRLFNRLLAAQPDGTLHKYDKRHLFSFAGEDAVLSPGQSQLILAWRGWNICPLICYDLRFPVWSRNRLIEGTPAYDLLVYVANWPAPRIHAWDDLLKARAHENQCVVVGVNRVGTDGKGLNYVGHSAVIDAKGAHLLAPIEGTETVPVTRLDRTSLDAFRKKFPVLLDGDQFHISP